MKPHHLVLAVLAITITAVCTLAALHPVPISMTIGFAAGLFTVWRRKR